MISLPDDATRKPTLGDRSERPPQNPPQKTGVWTVGELLHWTEKRFSALGMSSPRLDAELLLAHCMGVTRLELYTGFAKIVEGPERAAFRELVARRCHYEPVAYLTGTREFYSLEFEVGPGVLIPRPETELLVEWALEEIEGFSAETVKVLDLGTGSGNIAIAIAANAPRARVTAVDISREALEVARRNVERHHLSDRVSLVQGDLFEALDDDALRFDVIVSNPPYVARDEYDDLMPDVRKYEPSLALLDTRSGDGLGFYRSVINSAGRVLPHFVVPGGSAALELGATQASEVRELFLQIGWRDIHVRSDYGGIERVIGARDPRSHPGSADTEAESESESGAESGSPIADAGSHTGGESPNSES